MTVQQNLVNLGKLTIFYRESVFLLRSTKDERMVGLLTLVLEDVSKEMDILTARIESDFPEEHELFIRECIECFQGTKTTNEDDQP